MTKEQFFSPTVREWIKEVNEKHPHMTNEEFLELFEDWFNHNEESIVLNESIDLSKFRRVDEKLDDFEEFEEDDGDKDEDDEISKDTDSKEDVVDETPVEKPVRPAKKEDDDFDEFEEDEDEKKSGETFKDVAGGDKEIKEKPIAPKILTADEAEAISSKIKGKYLVNNGKDYEHNIFSVVNAWYDDCINTGSGENMLEHNRISLLDTGVVDDMRALFAFANVPNLDLSGWDTSAVCNMEGMFYKSTFDSDSILDWDVSMCTNFKHMFDHCRMSYDIKSHWTPGKVQKIVYDEFGKPKMVEVKDPTTGKVEMDATGRYPKTKVEKIWVDADLPEIGNRKHTLNDAKNKRIVAKLRELDKADKDRSEKEKEDKRMSHMEEGKKMKHIIDYDEFINEGFIDKIKNAFKAIATKINGFYVAMFKEDGKSYNAVSKYTTLNYVAAGNVPGVNAYSGQCELLNADIKDTADVPESGEYYGYIKPGSREYENYLTFLEMVGDMKDDRITEARMPLSSEGSGIDGVADIGSETLSRMLEEMLSEAPAYKRPGEESKTLMIFGAPGIGKSSIPKAIIEAYNKKAEKEGRGKKALITIECGDLTLDGLYLPIPDTTTLFDEVQEHPDAIKKLGFGEEVLNKLKKIKKRTTLEAPKTWLPVYEPSVDRDINLANNAIANGRKVEKQVWDEELGECVPVVEETTEGGIIMFDEFLRADTEMFKVLMQIILNRKYGENKFGSKWAFLCCSNRPIDDKEVEKRYDGLSSAAATRFLKGVYNFIPDFYEWKKWAETEGHFDEHTLGFISRTTDENKRDDYVVSGPSGDEKITTFSNWHNVDIDDKRNFISPMPRTWAALMDDINTEIKNRGVDSILDLPIEWIRNSAVGKIGKDTGNRYANYLSAIARKGAVKVKSLMTEDGYTVDTDEFPCSEVSTRVVDYIKTNYYRRKGEVKLPTDRELYTMTKNMDAMYGDNAGSHLTAMHMEIVNFFKIKSTDEAIISKLKNYLKNIGKKYDIDYVDDKPIVF